MTAADHANTVREGFDFKDGPVFRRHRAALAALDALQTQAETAEAERDHARDALRKIARQADHIDKARHIARAALGDKP